MIAGTWLFSHTKRTGSFQIAAMLSASWKRPWWEVGVSTLHLVHYMADYGSTQHGHTWLEAPSPK